jgi:alpha-galactosidase
MDYAMLAVHSLQSTSDQQDPVRYAAIAAAVPTAVTPEQSATWAYSQPDWNDEKSAITVINSLLGQIHLSSRLDLLTPHQLELISSGMKVYKQIRSDLRTGLRRRPCHEPKELPHQSLLTSNFPGVVKISSLPVILAFSSPKEISGYLYAHA